MTNNTQEAVQYIQDCLEQSHTLARMLLELPLESGDVSATLPDDADEEACNRYEVGGVIHQQGAEQLLAEFISAYLDLSPNRYAVFEDMLSRLGDPWLSLKNPTFVSFGEHLYHFASTQNNDLLSIIKTMRHAWSHVFVGVLTRLNPENMLQSGQAVTEDTLRALVEGTEAIIVGAYDGEGALIWKPKL